MSLSAALRLGSSIGSALWLRRRPFLLYLKPTPRCDCRCQSCNRWQDEHREPELDLAEIRALLQRYRQAGCVVLTLWGGEPTLRPDLPEILRTAKQLGYRTSMCTNARMLERKAESILPALDVLLCSLDGHGAVHDEVRSVDGLFERVVAGVKAAQSINPRCDIKFWGSVHQKNIHQLRDMATLARELGVGIEFFPLTPIPGYNDALLLTAAAQAQAFEELRHLRKTGWPVRNPDRALSIMGSRKAVACNFGRISIHVDHQGRVYSCENAQGEPLHLWGTLRKVDPEAIFASAEFRHVGKRLRACNQCRLPCAVELSGNLPRALGSMFFKQH